MSIFNEILLKEEKKKEGPRLVREEDEEEEDEERLAFTLAKDKEEYHRFVAVCFYSILFKRLADLSRILLKLTVALL